MKILRLDLRAFGPFTDVTVDLSAGCEGLHLIFGPNEAGKSSALRALGQLLYGIPGNSTDDFRHPFPKLRIGATLAHRDGTRLEILRRKGLKNTLLAADDKTPVDESQLRTFLGGCDQAQFDTMFGINHGSLQAGGRDIVSGKGEVGHVLFAAGAGIADLRSIRAKLESEAEALFKPGGSKPAINQHIAALKEAKKQVRDAQLPSTEWSQHDKALREATASLSQLEGRLQEAQREANRLTRIGTALPVIGKRRQLQQSLAELGDVPRLAENFAELRFEAQTQLDVVEKTEQAARDAIEQIDRQLADLVVPEDMLARADEIENAYRALSVYRKAQADLPGLLAKKEQLQRDAQAILADLRPDLTLEAAQQLRLAKRQQVEIQNLGNRQEALQKQLEQAQGQIADLDCRLAEAQSQLDSQPQPRDPAPLKDAVRQTQAQGNLPQQLAETLAEVRQLQQQADVGLKRLGLWSGSLEALEGLALPAVETVDRFERELSEAQSAVARCQEAVDKARSAIADLDRQLDALRLEGDVPTEDDLAAARRLRDQGWQLVRAEWRHDKADDKLLGEFLSRFAANTGLAEAYEQAVRAADDLADRLRREANRVATRATLEAHRSAQDRQIAATSRQLADAETAREQIAQAWRQCWRSPGIEPLPPREMRGWLARQQALVSQVQTIRQRQAAAVQFSDRIAEHRNRLQVRLDELGYPAGNLQEDLPALLARAAAVIADVERGAETRRQLQRDIAQWNQALGTAAGQVKKAEAELGQWHGQWATAVERLGLSADASPAVVNEVVAQMNDLFTRLKEAETYTERIEAIRQDGRRFEDEVQRLVREVAPELASLGHEQAAQEMSARLRKAAADRQQAALLGQQRKQHDEKRQKARGMMDQMQAQLRALCQEASCGDAAELPQIERKANEAAALRAQLASCEEELLRLGAGATVGDLVAEADAVHADELPAERRRAEERIAELQQDRDKLRDSIATEKAVLATMDPSAAAAEAAEEAQNLLAEIQPNVEQYVRLRLASAVLRDGIDRYRKKNEGPVLARASELFRRLTLGSFEGLRTDFDQRGEQVLLGVRRGGETVSPGGMSDGACDQLYLALRLASLETWLQRNEPLPFIVDDILVSFDNDRAAATLEVLAELSRRTQVIFFTHHEHLVELARQRVPEGALLVHGL